MRGARRESYKAWALMHRYPGKGEEPFLVGRYWGGGEVPPPKMMGHVLCAFQTRREARAAAKKSSYGKTWVVRVEVTMRRVR